MRDEPARIRTRLQQATGLPLPSPFERRREGRAAVRVVAHLRARLGLVAGRTIDGWTRNLSLAGVLVAISGEPPAVGEKVQVSIVHPTTGEARPIPGIIARHDVDQSGGVHGVGIRFLVCSQEAQATHEFLEQVKASEHARRLGAVTGSIDTLGLDDLLLSFGRCVPRGRFTLIGPDAVGTVHVADGRLVGAQVSDEIGVDALVRMSTWQSGRFEFHAKRRSRGRGAEPDAAGGGGAARGRAASGRAGALEGFRGAGIAQHAGAVRRIVSHVRFRRAGDAAARPDP